MKVSEFIFYRGGIHPAHKILFSNTINQHKPKPPDFHNAFISLRNDSHLSKPGKTPH